MMQVTPPATGNKVGADRLEIKLDGPLVSVIIPTYNHALYLPDAIRSVLGQTYRNFEIIIVDDGSTDNTNEVVANYKNQVHNIWQENKGLSAARNVGLRAATGELISLLDADDMYEPEFLATLVSILQTNPDLDGVYCSAQAVDADNHPLPQIIGKHVPPERFEVELLGGGFFPVHCMSAHKYCYQQMDYLFDESLTACEDWDIWLRFSRHHNILGIDKVLARYRMLPDSMSKDPVRMFTNREEVLRKYFAEGSMDQSQYSLVRRISLGRLHIRTATEYLQLNDEDNAYRFFQSAILTDPDVLADSSVLYELALGSQPMGFRGDFETLDLRYNARMLINWLVQLFQIPNLPTEIKSKYRVAFANVYFVIGLLNYGRRDFTDSRQYILKAITTEPRYLFKAQLVTTLAKSLLPVCVVNWFKNQRLATPFS